MKYIGGLIDYTYPITVYAETHPANLMNLYGNENIWIDQEDVKKHGALILGKHVDEVQGCAKASCPYIQEELIVPETFTMDLVNALGLGRKYTIFYFMVPPSE